ncbi:unnamed protein product [Clonostachys solani]|uniref:SGNH hydrolase-type esterase domain-containing protein n=1 Tax=Clonostachys solani TaxID=160281 RepID=A0A9P0EQW8_9HYPO|nr:unnamed protein product [Clonostachys solani]
MVGVLKTLGSLAALGLAQLANAQGGVFHIMPLGASITFGVGSSTGNGYRGPLLNTLASTGWSIDMVGSQRGGNMVDPDNEGFPGLRIEQVHHDKAVVDVPVYRPHLYLINLGTNDASQNYDLGNAGARMNDLFNYLWAITPDSTIILSTLVINRNAAVDDRVRQINTQYTNLANTLRSQGRKIVLVDMHGSNGPQSNEMSDDTHPNDAGFQKMANIFYQGILEGSRAGFF